MCFLQLQVPLGFVRISHKEFRSSFICRGVYIRGVYIRNQFLYPQKLIHIYRLDIFWFVSLQKFEYSPWNVHNYNVESLP